MERGGRFKPPHPPQWGVGLLFSRAFNPNSLEVQRCIEGRLLLVKAHFDLFKLVLINIYAPTAGAERKQFFLKLKEVVSGCGSEDYLFLGGV